MSPTTITAEPTPSMPESRIILDDVDELIHGDRAEQYGDAQQSFENIADIWSVVVGAPVTTKQVALMLAGLKLARLAHDTGHRDSWVDLIGYAALGSGAK